MLIERLRDDMKTAMKAKKAGELSTIRSLIAAIQKEQVAQASSRELTDAEVEKLLASEAKKRQESADSFVEAERPEMAEKELSEKAIIEKYLPEKLSDDELEVAVDEVLSKGGYSSMADMGAAMKAVNADIGNRAEGAKLAALVKSKLQG